jgi:phosphate/sulfate permease
MTTPSDVERAERISRRRARMFPFLGIYFIAGQAVFFRHTDASARITQFKISAWLVWALVLLIAFAFAGGHFQGKRIRALVEDDVARANRAKGYEAGFWAAAAAAIALYITNMFEPVSGRDAIHLILTALVGAAMIRFGTLERRALKEG